MDKLIKRSDSWVPKGAFPDSFFVFHNTVLKKHPEKRKRDPLLLIPLQLLLLLLLLEVRSK